VAQARASLRLQLAAQAYPPLFIGRATAMFTGLCEVMLAFNNDSPLCLRMTLLCGGCRGVLLIGRLSLPESAISEVEAALMPFRSILNRCSVCPVEDAVQIMVGLVDEGAV
jgi:hypothetical protein